jgi:hypothetical protein
MVMGTDSWDTDAQDEDYGALDSGHDEADDIEELDGVAIPEVESKPDTVFQDNTNPTTRLYLLLLAQVRHKIPKPKVFTDWRAPTTGALIGFSPARFGVLSWDPTPPPANFVQFDSSFGEDDAGLNKAESESFTKARRHSITALEAAASASPKDTNTFDEAVKYLLNVILSQTPLEKLRYEAICRRMAKCATRPAEAESIAAQCMWSAKVRDDDWWHVRRLLQMLCKLSSLREDLHNSFERRLRMLLAATGVQVKHCFGFYHLRVFSRTFPSIQCGLTNPTGMTAQKAHELGSKFFENCAPRSMPLRFKTLCYAHILEEIVQTRMRRGMSRDGTLLFMATILVVQIPAVFVCSQAQELSQLN